MVLDLDTVSLSPSGSYSKWNAALNPIVYRMQRKDFTFASITDAGGFVRLVLDSSFGNVASSFDVDDEVYFITDGGVYGVIGIVTASSYSAPNTLVTLDTTYISSSTGFVNNDYLRPQYRVEIEVYNGSDEQIGDSAFSYSPSPSGELIINIASLVKSVLSPDIDADITETTKVFDDSGIYTAFYIKYREVWTGSAESQTSDSSNEYYGVLGALQIRSAYGGNLYEYVCFNSGSPKANFLTRFERPVMWRGWPFLLNAIIDIDMSGNIFLSASSGSSTPASYTGKIALFDLNQIITSQNNYDEVDITVYRDSSPDVELTNSLTIELRDPCENPVMLMARNSLGGVMQWMFDVSQEESFDYGNAIKNKRSKLIAENLTYDQWLKLHDFFTLGEIYRDNIEEFTSETIKTHSRIGSQAYVIDEDGNKTGVIILTTRNKTDTRQIKHSFELEIEYPEIF